MRNSQASVLAPTGTIGLMMDCDTTGIEPDLGLVKMKKLVGGGTMSIVNQTIPRALRRLGYTAAQVDDIIAYIDTEKSILGAPHLDPEHLAGVRLLDGRQHDPLRGPRADDGCGPAVPVRRHLARRSTCPRRPPSRTSRRCTSCRGSSASRPSPSTATTARSASRCRRRRRATAPAVADGVVETIVEKVVEKVVHRPLRQKLPRSRRGRTFEFRVADCKGFATIGEYDDGRPGEIFLTVSKQGSTLSGIMDAFAKSISYGLQYGVPLRAFVEAFTNMRFEPAGMTDDPDIRFATLDHGLPVPPPGASST